MITCADSFHRRGGNEKTNKKNQKGRETVCRANPNFSKSGWRQGLEPAINKRGPHKSAALSTTPASGSLHISILFYDSDSGSLHISILFYDSVLVSIFFSTYILGIGLTVNYEANYVYVILYNYIHIIETCVSIFFFVKYR